MLKLVIHFQILIMKTTHVQNGHIDKFTIFLKKKLVIFPYVLIFFFFKWKSM